MNESQWNEAIRKGDADALARLIDAKRRPLLAFIQRKMSAALQSKLEAEDVLQEVCADAVKALEAVDLSERDPFSWLCQIAERRIVDAHRRFFGAQKRDAGRERPLMTQQSDGQEGGLIHLLVASLTTASQAFSRNAREARLWKALQELPEDQQRALRLRYVDSRPSKEIAAALAKSDAAVRVMLTRSLKKLKTILEREETTE